MKIINEEPNDNKVLDDNKIASIVDFRNKIKSTGLVSSADIISLEELVETPIMTETTPINNFTSYRSKVGVEKVLETLNTYSVKNEVITNEMVLELAYEARHRLSMLKNIVTTLVSISNDRLTTLTDPKILSTWNDNKYIELGDENLFDVLMNHGIRTRLGLDNGFLETLFNKSDFNSNMTINNLLNMLISGKVSIHNFNNATYREITYNDIINIINGSNNILPKLDEAYTHIDSIVNFTTSVASWWLSENEDLVMAYKRLSKYYEYLDDKQSILILRSFATLNEKD